MNRITMPTAKGKANSPSFSVAFKEFITDSAARGLSNKTLRTYENHFHCVSLHFDTEIRLSELTRSALNEMVVSMRESGLATNSICSYTRVVTTFLNWCNRQQYCQVTMPKYKEEETLKETYTDKELEQLLKRPADTCRFSVYRTWVIINFLLNAGCRAATVRNIMVGDVDLLQQQVFFRHTKNRKVQVIPLCSQMTKILREYMSIRGGENDSYLFCDEFGEQLTENALRLAVARYNKSRGVTKTSIHLFRHTFARKYLIDCGGDAFTLQKLMGHSTLKMTKHYCAIFDADIAKNYDNFSPLAQMKQDGERVRLRRQP